MRVVNPFRILFVCLWKLGNGSPEKYERLTGEKLASACGQWSRSVEVFPHIPTITEDWMKELGLFLELDPKLQGYRDLFFRRLAIPMLKAWQTLHGSGEPAERCRRALNQLKEVAVPGWRDAAEKWVRAKEAEWTGRV